MTSFTLAIRKASEIDRVLKRTKLYLSGWVGGVINHRVADSAIVPDHLASLTHMFTVMAAKTT